MTAGSTLDKIGPMCRSVEDCAIVLHAIAGPDGYDLAVPEHMPFGWDATLQTYPQRIGYVPAMFEGASDADARVNNDRVLATLRRMGCLLVEVALPSGDLSYFIEYIERAAAFDSFTNAGLHKGLQPRTSQFLRACQLTTAVDYLQANRRRLEIMRTVADVMRDVDALVFTALTLDSRTSLNPVLSLTGHPVDRRTERIRRVWIANGGDVLRTSVPGGPTAVAGSRLRNGQSAQSGTAAAVRREGQRQK